MHATQKHQRIRNIPLHQAFRNLEEAGRFDNTTVWDNHPTMVYFIAAC